MSGSNLSCQHCGFSQLCLPFTLNNAELDTLDDIIERKKPLHKGDFLIEAGTALHSLYAVRSGSFKTFTLTESGEEQITGFHLPGDVIGFDAIGGGQLAGRIPGALHAGHHFRTVRHVHRHDLLGQHRAGGLWGE